MLNRQRNRTGNQALLRQINLSAIMLNLHKSSPVSRAALAEITGLNKTTVSSLIQELLDAQLVHEIGFGSTGTGRPAVLLELNPQAGFMIGAEIGVDFISVLCTDFAITPIWQHRENISPKIGQPQITNRTLELIGLAIANTNSNYGRLLGIAVGVPGLVNQVDGSLLFAPNLGWRDVPLKSIFAQTFNVPIFVNNEANMAALGEHYFGAAKTYDEVLYVSAGVGLGGAVIQGGHLLAGGAGFAGEFGHMTMNPNGKLCNCGNRGCWETQVSQSALIAYVRQAISQSPQPTPLLQLTQSNLDDMTVPLIIKAANQDDAVAKAALNTVGRYLGIGIASLVNVLNPGMVVFGGILALADKYILPAINRQLQARALSWNQNAVKVVTARHGIDACVIGGVATIYQSILKYPNQFIQQNF